MRSFRRVLSVPEHSHNKQKNAGRRRNTRAVIGLYVCSDRTVLSVCVGHSGGDRCLCVWSTIGGSRSPSNRA